MFILINMHYSDYLEFKNLRKCIMLSISKKTFKNIFRTLSGWTLTKHPINMNLNPEIIGRVFYAKNCICDKLYLSTLNNSLSIIRSYRFSLYN